MPAILPNTTIAQFQNFINEVYGLPNDRHFSTEDMLSNIERFTMRALKGIRKEDYEKTKTNLLIALSWFMSVLNRIHINLENEIWKRFPYSCSYCGLQPCACKEKGVKSRIKKQDLDSAANDKRPATLKDFQTMFEKIYPAQKRTLEHAGIHLAEELGEFSESLLVYRGEHKDGHFDNIAAEAADVFSCFMGVLNSLKIKLAEELAKKYSENCHVCKKAPCECSFSFIVGYKS